MGYDEKLVNRVREALADVKKIQEKQMFGGIAFMVNGKMCVTVRDKRIMVRIDPEMHDKLVEQNGAETMMMAGRSYKGFIRVSEEAITSKKNLNFWIGLAVDFNKKAKATPKKSRK